MVARRAHNPKVAGSNPAPATNEDPCYGRDLLRFQPTYADRDIDVRPRAGRETFKVHECDLVEPTPHIDELIEEVKRDPTCIFWG